MESPVDVYSAAWCPLTPRGVAAFARASVGRLMVVQSLVAALASGTVVWCIHQAWFPALGRAIEQLPAGGQIRSGELSWPADSPRILAETRFLSIAVDLAHAGQARSPAHLQLEFGRNDVRFYSLFGCLPLAYPRTYAIALDVQTLKPWWGAWAPFLLVAAGAACWLGLMTSWLVLSTLYCSGGWLLGLYLNRELTLGGSWRVAGAALMPGALLITAAIGWYGLGQLEIPQLLAAGALHLVVGWGYLVLGILAAPRIQAELSLKANPFSTPDPADATPPLKAQQPNPFRPRGD